MKDILLNSHLTIIYCLNQSKDFLVENMETMKLSQSMKNNLREKAAS